MGKRTSRPTESEVAGRSSMHSPSGLLGVIVSGDTPTFTPWFPDPCILPLVTQHNVIVIALGVSCVYTLWVSSLNWHLSCTFNGLFCLFVNVAASREMNNMVGPVDLTVMCHTVSPPWSNALLHKILCW